MHLTENGLQSYESLKYNTNVPFHHGNNLVILQKQASQRFLPIPVRQRHKSTKKVRSLARNMAKGQQIQGNGTLTNCFKYVPYLCTNS